MSEGTVDDVVGFSGFVTRGYGPSIEYTCFWGQRAAVLRRLRKVHFVI